MENFVDRVLGKNKTDASRRAFDYKNRISLLAYFAEKMTLTGKYLVEFTELYGWANEYFKSIEIQHDVHQLITEFCEARIFALRGNSIQFQHDMFLSYFSAQRMISSNDFARIIIEQAQRFPKEIDIFCGIRRFDETIIGILEEKFADVDRRLLAEFPGLPPLTFVSEFQVPKHETVDAIFTSVTNQLTGARLSDSERDKMLEDDQEAEIEKSTNQLARPAAKYVAIEWLETLRAYTVALKNLEEISAEKKAHHLVIVLDAWARAIGYLITLIRNAFDAEIDLGGGVKLDLGKTFGDSKPFLLRWLFISMPNTISNILRYDLGTEKLQALLRKSQPAGNEPVPIRFLNEGLYLDMQLPEFLRRIQALKDSIRDNRFFSESLLLKLQDCYVRFPVKDDGTDVAFRNLLAELTVELAGDRRGIEKDKAISAAVEDVKKKQLIARLRGDEQ